MFVKTFIPCATGIEQEATRFRAPSTSTTHTRQAPIGCSAFDVAQRGNANARLLGGVEDRRSLGNLDRQVVDTQARSSRFLDTILCARAETAVSPLQRLP